MDQYKDLTVNFISIYNRNFYSIMPQDKQKNRQVSPPRNQIVRQSIKNKNTRVNPPENQIFKQSIINKNPRSLSHLKSSEFRSPNDELNFSKYFSTWDPLRKAGHRTVNDP